MNEYGDTVGKAMDAELRQWYRTKQFVLLFFIIIYLFIYHREKENWMWWMYVLEHCTKSLIICEEEFEIKTEKLGLSHHLTLLGIGNRAIKPLGLSLGAEWGSNVPTGDTLPLVFVAMEQKTWLSEVNGTAHKFLCAISTSGSFL